MAQFITTILLELIFISPLIALGLDRPDRKWKLLILFALFYVGYSFLLFAPLLFPQLRFIVSEWNWSGKTYALAGSILFYVLFRKVFTEHDFMTFRQRPTRLKPLLYVTMLVFLTAIVAAIWYVEPSATRSAFLWFQFTMPGLDEEIAFRGIMLGLLSNALRLKISISTLNLGNPALWITSILFGLCHSFHIDPGWTVHQDWYPFFNTFLPGLLFGWLTLKSGSIVMAILVHSLSNTIPGLVVWNR